jgi:5-methyltetrahydropteroyltriglutamate--homocysteine methyltransferase
MSADLSTAPTGEITERPVDRIMTTHVGSLVRPDALVDVLRARRDGDAYDPAVHAEIVEREVRDVVRQQAELGIDFVSDGEFGKGLAWWSYVLERLEGFEERPWGEGGRREPERQSKDKRDFAEFYDEYNRQTRPEGYPEKGEYVCTGPIVYTGQDQVAADIANLKTAIEAVGVEGGFLPVVAPASVVPVRRDEHYASEEEFVFAVADALNDEYRAIADSGLLVQVDDAFLATMYDSMVPPAAVGEYRAWAELRVAALNRALEGIPAERVRYHVCWGSWNGPHTNDVPLRDIVDLVLQVNAGAYALEQANPRHEHEWRVWQDVELPAGKVLLPGVVCHSTNVVEHPELVCERIVRLAKLVGRDRVIASTDCGFAQSPFIRRVHPSIQWAKLGALVEGARLATEELWG